MPLLKSLIRSDTLPLWSLPLLVILVYAIALPGHFFMDDAQIVLNNLLVYSPNLKIIFTADYWGAGENTGLFRPLTILSFALNYMILGAGAWGYLLVNILLHATVCVLFYLWLRSILLSREISWFAAALFAVHPIHGEAVIQLVGRSELLVAIFVLLALIAARTPGRSSTIVIVVCYLGAILSKEHGVVLIALLPAVDLFCDRLSCRELLRRRGGVLATLVGITALWLLYRHYVVHFGLPAPLALDPYYTPLASADPMTRILSALKVQLFYLAKQLVPLHLQGMYPKATVAPFIGWFSFQAGLIAAAVAALLAAAVVGWRRQAVWGLAIVLYAICFSPTSNIFIVAGFTMAERVVYLPSLWFCAGLSAALAAIPSLGQRLHLFRGAAGILVAVYALLGVLRFYDFREPERYWLHDLRINPQNELSLLMLADYYRGSDRLQEAEARGRELTTTVAPDFKEGLSNYAGILVELGRPQEAIPVAQRALALEQASEVSTAKIPLTAAYIKLGRVEDALATLQLVRSTDRNQPVYWELYGNALEARGDYIGALACYQREAGSSGGRAKDGLRRLGKVLLQLGRHSEAEAELRRDVRIHPLAADGWNALGIALDLQGKTAEAQQAFAKAVELRPGSAEYRTNLQQSRQRTMRQRAEVSATDIPVVK